MTPAVEAHGLRKSYGPVLAVDDLSFEVRPGEIVGVLGPNGAGKTTALQLCLRLLHADAGEARLFGLDPEDLAARRRIGYAPDSPLFPRSLTGARIMDLHADLLEVPRAKAAELVERFGFAEPAQRPTATYSRGQLQRLGLAQALLGEPALLLVDEPTAGLDPAGVAFVRELLIGLRARGGSVLLNSHLLSEVERICDRVLFMKNGRLLRTHDSRAGGRRAEIKLANASRLAARLAQKFPDSALDGPHFRIAIASEDVVPALVRQLVEMEAEVLEVTVKGAELEELYLQIVEGRA